MAKISSPRTYDALLRRQQLTDAGIEVLGTVGKLSHPRVDRQAGMPAGTTSFYFRTRNALYCAVASRINELDARDLSDMTASGHDDRRCSATQELARWVITAGSEPHIARTRARYQVKLAARLDPDLRQIARLSDSRFRELVRSVLDRHNAAAPPRQAALLDERTAVATTFISGVILSFVQDRPVVTATEHLDRLIQGVLCAVDIPDGNS